MSNESENPRSEELAPGIEKVYYSLVDLRKALPDGVKVREESVGADGVLIHIQYPPNALDSIQQDERLKNFMIKVAQSVNRKVSIIASRNDLDIRVKRPRSVSLQMNEVTVPKQTVIDEIRSIVEDNSVTTATVSITNTHIVEDQPQPQPQPQLTLEAVEQLIRRVVSEELEKRKPKRTTKKTPVKSESPPKMEAIPDKGTMAVNPTKAESTVTRTPLKKKAKTIGKSNGKHKPADTGTVTKSAPQPRKTRSKRQIESTLDL